MRLGAAVILAVGILCISVGKLVQSMVGDPDHDKAVGTTVQLLGFGFAAVGFVMLMLTL